MVEFNPRLSSIKGLLQGGEQCKVEFNPWLNSIKGRLQSMFDFNVRLTLSKFLVTLVKNIDFTPYLLHGPCFYRNAPNT